ncbi:MAG TPA: formyltransferase family protein [Bdellovibrio sp.]|nr:formyltransferase family protein [Bdellovibrio sp.]
MNNKIVLLLMTEKGLSVLKRVLKTYPADLVSKVIVCRDEAVKNDFADDIIDLCEQHSIKVSDKLSEKDVESLCFAVSWRKIIPASTAKRLIVFHDSVLPKYRGFNPLVTSLLNGDEEIGATALWAAEKYDRGRVITQKSVKVKYPIKIQSAIKMVCELYEEMIVEIIGQMIHGKLDQGFAQDDSLATYSVWRDEQDYWVNWDWHASYMQRFVNAVGFPYKGARALLEQQPVRITDAEAVPDLDIKNRVPGKIFELEDGSPVVICGTGLLKVTGLISESGESLLPLKKLKQRFSSHHDM